MLGNAGFGDFIPLQNNGTEFMELITSMINFIINTTGYSPSVVYINPYLLRNVEEDLGIEHAKYLQLSNGFKLDVCVDFKELFVRFE